MSQMYAKTQDTKKDCILGLFMYIIPVFAIANHRGRKKSLIFSRSVYQNLRHKIPFNVTFILSLVKSRIIQNTLYEVLHEIINKQLQIQLSSQWKFVPRSYKQVWTTRACVISGNIMYTTMVRICLYDHDLNIKQQQK